MKLIKLSVLSLLFATIATSCNLDNDDNYVSNTFSCCNLVTDASGNSYVSDGSYKATFYLDNGLIDISTAALDIAGKEYSFNSDKMKVTTKYYSVPWTSSPADISSFSGGYASGAISVSDLSGNLSSLVYLVNTNNPINNLYPFVGRVAVSLNYKVNDTYTVKTFMPESVYSGTTVITDDSGTFPEFTSESTLYRVIFSSDRQKADLIIYNAKFAQMMPEINFLVKDLQVQYNNGSYTISIPAGQSINPSTYEGDGLTENPNYPFTSLELRPIDSALTKVDIDFKISVRGMPFTCRFTGSSQYPVND
ncbi:MAG: hypothetical protein J1E97_03135 [Muribaculaceae bacterium]|nr:hypothetical protein [Muribaculaceae bacterium]